MGGWVIARSENSFHFLSLPSRYLSLALRLTSCCAGRPDPAALLSSGLKRRVGVLWGGESCGGWGWGGVVVWLGG